MIDPPAALTPGIRKPPEIVRPPRLPVPAGIGRLLVLTVVFLCAACGLVYELELVALSSYLVGDSVTQASVVLSVMVFAMGVGSLLAKRLRCRAAVGFGAVEAALALIGGVSAMALYACFAWLGQSRPALVAFSLLIGVLIGAEVPLLMTLIQRIRNQDAGGAVADLFAADYVGALVGGLAFPFLLLPVLGQLSGALVTGGVNAVAGGALVLGLFGRDLSPRARRWLLAANVLVLALLTTCTALAGPFERVAREAVYGTAPRVARQTDVQEVVLTGGTGDGRADRGGTARPPLALYLDGRLRVSALDEYRYHEALVHPAMAGGPHGRVLVLGGGDGLAVRELLRYPDVQSVTVVERDGALVRLARTDPGLARLNHHALDDPRVRVVTGDAFDWLRWDARREVRRDGPYDVVLSDQPDPGITAGAKLYSQEFYGLVARVLAPDGRLAVHAGPPAARPRSFWTVEASMRAAGLRTVPYRQPGRLHASAGGPDRGLPGTAGPATGTVRYWGFVLAGRTTPHLGLSPEAPRLRSLTPQALRSGRLALARTRPAGLPPSTLVHPRYGD
ncbi:spermidine synthase [Streptomyces sp. Ru73]|uniref:polyamine aminopropyltransferase n=1 Tax=Streptomyces sp. Ru73 TaxID=2080748 RepID=UPI000CDE0236|nr:polyamine aminopropyltransferase [Streptomyces sp. Ru73]POX42076.1 spermidine synthase [Streptomyces sp. Ru73]